VSNCKLHNFAHTTNLKDCNILIPLHVNHYQNKMGFNKCLVPSENLKRMNHLKVKDIEIIGVNTVAEAVEKMFNLEL